MRISDCSSDVCSSDLFDLDDYVYYVIQFLEHIGPGTHMLAVCQPSVPCYAAACIMSEDKNPARPRTLTMMGGPIDTRESPTVVDRWATERPLPWSARHVVAPVPFTYPRDGRTAYPAYSPPAES